MGFNQKKDKIAISIPKFTLKKNADRGLFRSKYNEPYFLSMAIDSHGVKTSKIGFNYNPFPNVSAGQSVEMMGVGSLVYGPENPGDFVALSILMMEDDQEIRKTGEILEEIIQKEAVKTGIKSAMKLNPTANAVFGVLKEVSEFVSGILKKNKDDELFRYQGCFLRDTPVPYEINRKFTGSNDYAEVSVQIIPLEKNEERSCVVGVVEL